MFKNKLTDREEEYNILKKIENNFKREFNLTPCLGAELEFYLTNLTGAWQLTKLEDGIEQVIKKKRDITNMKLRFHLQLTLPLIQVA